MARVTWPVGRCEDVAARSRRRGSPALPGWIFALRLWSISGGQVADLQLEPGDDQQVGARELEDERGLRVDEVGILIALGQRLGLDEIPADRLRDRGEILERRDDADLRHGRDRRRRGRMQRRRAAPRAFSWWTSQKGWAPWAPMRELDLQENLVGGLPVGVVRRRNSLRSWENSLGQKVRITASPRSWSAESSASSARLVARADEPALRELVLAGEEPADGGLGPARARPSGSG